MADAPETFASRFPVAWGPLTSGKFLDQDDCNVIQKYQKLSLDEIGERVSTQQDEAKELAQALAKLVRVTTETAAAGLACALSAALVASDRKNVALFVSNENTLPAQEFARALISVPGVEVDASKVLAAFASGGNSAQLANFTIQPVLAWVNDQIRPDAAFQPKNGVGLRCAAALFRNRDFRLGFISSEGVESVIAYVAQKMTGVTPEALYRAHFCLWSLSYHDEAVSAVCTNHAVNQLINKSLPHVDDKVSRLGLATLVNLLNKEDSEQGIILNDVMVEANVGKSLIELALRKWTAKDQKDVDSHIARLNKVLGAKFLSLNSFDRYMAEVTSETLKPGPMHSDKFWSENATSFEHNNFVAIRHLVDHLSSDDVNTVVLACQDLGEFARFYDGGKKIIQHYKGKSKIMGLMAHENRDIQKAALLSSAKLLITNWEHV